MDDEVTHVPQGGRMTLLELLKDEELSLRFRDFLHTMHGGENLAFWLEVELFRALEGQEQNQDLIEYASEEHLFDSGQLFHHFNTDFDLYNSYRGLISSPRARALDIFAKFIRPRGAQEINIDSERRMQLMLEMSNIKFNLFDEAQQEILMLLETDSIPKFRKDPAYIQWMEVKAKKKQEKAKDKSKKEKKTKEAKSKHSLMSRLLGKDHEQQGDQRGRASTLDALKTWREQHQHKKPASPSPPHSSTSTSPLRGASLSPSPPPAAAAATADADSPLSISAPNPTRTQPTLTTSRSLTSIHGAIKKSAQRRPKSGAMASPVVVPP